MPKSVNPTINTRDELSKIAKERQSLNGGDKKSENSKRSSPQIEKTTTSKELAKLAKVSHDTYNKGKKIIELDEQVKKRFT